MSKRPSGYLLVILFLVADGQKSVVNFDNLIVGDLTEIKIELHDNFNE